MKVRFGFVAMSTILEDTSPAKTMTVKYFKKQEDKEEVLNKLLNIARTNLENTYQILQHCDKMDIHMYRFSSKLLPLLGIEGTESVNYFEKLEEEFKKIGDFVKEKDMRVSFHPAQFTVLNSPKEHVFKNSIQDLLYHVQQLEAMGLDEKTKMVLHVGGAYGDKDKAIERFIEQWKVVPASIQKRLILENDDKTFNAEEVVNLCEYINVPMVLDIHHHKCNHENEDLSPIIDRIFKTWNTTGIVPKIHVSSPKNEKEFRSHHDYINPDDLVPFLDLAKEYNQDLDIMIEAKKKDETLVQLMKDLSKNKDCKMIDGSSFVYK